LNPTPLEPETPQKEQISCSYDYGLFNRNILLDFIIRIMKSRRMRWAGHVARMGEKRNAYRLSVRKPE
jgi:hypothetical protein